MISLEKQEQILLLKNSSVDWELYRVTAKDDTCCLIDFYVCYRNNVIQWLEGSEGFAYSKFMNIIPNQIANKKVP